MYKKEKKEKKEKNEHAFQAFSRDIKENMPPVLFLYGEEAYLIRWAVETLIHKFVNPALMMFDYVHFQDEGEDSRALLEACNTFSMMSERRVIWVENYAPLRSANPKGFTLADLEQIEGYLKQPNESSLLIFSCEVPEPKSELVNLLKKECRCYRFDQLDRTTLNGFINKRFAAAGVPVSRNVIRAIVDRSGYFNKETEYRIFHLVNDIEKMIAYCQGGPVTEEAVSQVMDGDMDTFIFNLLDAACDHQKEKAFTMLYHILQSGREVYGILSMLVNQFEFMLEVAELKGEGMNLSQIKSCLKSNEYRTKKAMGYTEKFTVDKLKSILSQTYEVDRNIKTGMLEPTLALELLIGRI